MSEKNVRTNFEIVRGKRSTEEDIESEYNVIISQQKRRTPEINENCALLSNNMRLNISKYKNAFKNRNLIVDVLAIFFGISAWVGINSIYVQFPLLVKNAPEGWNLPSYLVVGIQIGNIGPLIYTIIQKFSPKKVKDAYMIYAVLVIGTIASILTAFLYDKTAKVNGVEHSVSLYVLVFLLALVGCTSSVLFMPYMGRFKEMYLITYFIGEGLSGFLPSTVAFVQGVGGNIECIPARNDTEGREYYKKYQPPPRFGTMEFFIFVFFVMSCSSIAFILLDKLKLCKKEYAAVKIGHGNDYEYAKDRDVMSQTSCGRNAATTDEDETSSGCDKNSKIAAEEKPKEISLAEYKFLMVLIGIICLFGNGVFPSIQSYSCLPYGNITYHLTVTLSSIANPVACFLAIFLPHTSIRSILTLSGFCVLLTSYTVTTALLSPSPPLQGSVVGEALIVISWTVLVGLISYIKLCITAVMRSQGGKTLVWTGGISQVGSAIGSIIIFALINYANIFSSYEPC